MTARVAASLDKTDNPIEVTEENLPELVQLGISEFFSEMVAGNPALITSLHSRRKYSELCASSMQRLIRKRTFRGALRFAARGHILY